MLPPDSTCVLSRGVTVRGTEALPAALYLRHRLADGLSEPPPLPTSTLPSFTTVLERDPCGPSQQGPLAASGL